MVVSVPKMKDFFTKISTPSEQKVMVAFPNAATHMIASPDFSKQLDDVKGKTFEFAETILGLKKSD